MLFVKAQFPSSFKMVSCLLHANPHQHIAHDILGVITGKLRFISELHMLNATLGPAEAKCSSPRCSKDLTDIFSNRRLIKNIEVVCSKQTLLLFNKEYAL